MLNEPHELRCCEGSSDQAHTRCLALVGQAKMDIWDAIIAHDAERVADIIRLGEDVNQAGSGGQTPLSLACECDAVSVCELLLKAGASLEKEDEESRTPLVIACSSGSMRAAKALIDAGASCRVTDENLMTPLHWFAMHGSPELIDRAARASAELDALNSSRQTPLCFAITRNQLASALLLLDAGADPWIKDEEKRGALHWAMQFGGGLGNCSESMRAYARPKWPAHPPAAPCSPLAPTPAPDAVQPPSGIGTGCCCCGCCSSIPT